MLIFLLRQKSIIKLIKFIQPHNDRNHCIDLALILNRLPSFPTRISQVKIFQLPKESNTKFKIKVTKAPNFDKKPAPNWKSKSTITRESNTAH